MKKLLSVFSFVMMTTTLSSCATIFGGRISDCQRTKPATGQPSREIRAAALILDVVLFWPGVGVDFLTGAIYKPCTPQSGSK